MSHNPPRNAHGRTLDQLGEAIVSGQYAPGDPVPPEPALCDSLGVSRTVVREAIKSLVAKGLVRTGPKVGTRVQPPEAWSGFDADVVRWQGLSGLTRERLRDLLDLRAAIEPLAARLAAERAQPADRQAMQTAWTAMKQAVDGGGDYAGAELAFHQALLQASGNRMLAQTGPALAILLRTAYELSVAAEGPGQMLARYKAVLDAVLAGAAPKAEKAAGKVAEAVAELMAPALTSKRKLPALRKPAAPLKAPLKASKGR